MAQIYLVHLFGKDDSNSPATDVTLRLSSGKYHRSNFDYRARISELDLVYDMESGLWNTRESNAFIQAINIDGGLDAWRVYRITSAEVRKGNSDNAYSNTNFPVVWSGPIREFRFRDESLEINIADRIGYLNDIINSTDLQGGASVSGTPGTVLRNHVTYSSAGFSTGITSSQVNTASFNVIDSLFTNTISIGLEEDDNDQNFLSLVDEALVGLPFSLASQRNANVFAPRFVVPTAGASVKTLHPTGELRFDTISPAGEIELTFTGTDGKIPGGTEFELEGVKTRWPAFWRKLPGGNIQFESGTNTERSTALSTIANASLNVFARRFDRVRFETLTDLSGINVGSVVSVQHPRFGFSSQKEGLVTRIKETVTGVTEVEMWTLSDLIPPGSITERTFREPVDAAGVGYEYLFTATDTDAAITGAANLPLATWPYDHAAAGPVTRGTQMYFRGTPTDLDEDKPYQIRFSRRITGVPSAGQSVGSVSWDQEAPTKIIAQDGQANSFRELECYMVVANTAAVPSKPSDDNNAGSYVFSTGVFTPPSGGWVIEFPAYTPKQLVYAITITADDIDGDTWTPDSASDWSTPVAVGNADDLNIIYTRSVSAPGTPTASADIPSGWYDNVANVPAATATNGFVWSSVGVRQRGGTTYNWQAPIRLEGGLTTTYRELEAYKTAANTAAAPTGPATIGAAGSYVFSTGVFTPPTGWVSAFPAYTPKQLVYAITTTANNADGDTWTPDAVGDWSSPVVVGNADDLNIIYRRSVSTPSTPSASAGIPAGWADNVSNVVAATPTNGQVYSSVGIRQRGGSTYTWQAPVRLEGVDGINGTYWHQVTAEPAANLGDIGDFAIVVGTNGNLEGNVYEKTAADTWTLRSNFKGADGGVWYTGSAAPTNSNPGGSNNDWYFRTGSGSVAGEIWRKVSGSWAKQVDIDQGTAGSVWHSGMGRPAAGLGEVGDYYFRTSNGWVYEKTSGAQVADYGEPPTTTPPTTELSANVNGPATLEPGATALYTVSVVGGSGAISYQWQRRESTSDSWSDVGTATTYSTSRSDEDPGTYYIRCVVTRGDDTVNSPTIVSVWDILNLPLTVDVTVDNSNPTPNTRVLFRRVVGGTLTGAITQQWQRRAGETGTWSNVGTGTTYSVARATAGTWYVRVIVTRGETTVTSDPPVRVQWGSTTAASTRTRTFYQRGTTAPAAPTLNTFAAYTTPGGGWGTTDPGATSTEDVYEVTLTQNFNHATTQDSTTFTSNSWSAVTVHEMKTGGSDLIASISVVEGTFEWSTRDDDNVNGTVEVYTTLTSGHDNTNTTITVFNTRRPGSEITNTRSTWNSVLERYENTFTEGVLRGTNQIDQGLYNFTVTVTRNSDDATDIETAEITVGADTSTRTRTFYQRGTTAPAAPTLNTFAAYTTPGGGWSTANPGVTSTQNVYAVTLTQNFNDSSTQDSTTFTSNSWSAVTVHERRAGTSDRQRTFYQRGTAAPAAPTLNTFAAYTTPGGGWSTTDPGATSTQDVYEVTLTQTFSHATTQNSTTFASNSWSPVTVHETRTSVVNLISSVRVDEGTFEWSTRDDDNVNETIEVYTTLVSGITNSDTTIDVTNTSRPGREITNTRNTWDSTLNRYRSTFTEGVLRGTNQIDHGTYNFSVEVTRTSDSATDTETGSITVGSAPVQTSTRTRIFYQRSSTTPSAPSSTAFSAYTTPGGGWSTSDPGSTTTQAVYQVTLTQTFNHASTQNSTTFASNAWSSVTVHEARKTVQTSTRTRIFYQRSSTTPSAPSSTAFSAYTTPGGGWSTSDPGSINASTQNSTTFASNAWSSVTVHEARKTVQTSTRTRIFYQRSSTTPSAPSSTAFSAYTTPGGGWSTSDPGSTTTQAVYEVTLTQTFNHATTRNSTTFASNSWSSVTVHEARKTVTPPPPPTINPISSVSITRGTFTYSTRDDENTTETIDIDVNLASGFTSSNTTVTITNTVNQGRTIRQNATTWATTTRRSTRYADGTLRSGLTLRHGTYTFSISATSGGSTQTITRSITIT